MAKEFLPGMRKDYGKDSLTKESVHQDPMMQFEAWFKDAMKSDGDEANVLTLSTLGEDQIPEGRIVLLKFYAEDGFTFYTNYTSNKAKQLEKHPYASMTFHWKSQERQVRIKGSISKVPAEISDAYFNERPYGSRIGAWASPQSQEIPNRDFLEDRVEEIQDKFENQNEIPRPEFWGGYLLTPVKIEFWQGRPSRLHDRIVYDLMDGQWVTKRLAP
ncbi:MAG: pyridoxamine 5'-phosphate oxidase [Reichenbachiella sp.]|uniref:pyridoxamine 5'-phosphate oxidase n=1 Tax=Reichenbachiella sp. TaxID=2184521 RepID=UPI002966BE8E|nr:pyridoxamine 5'-phosphate oxidase [Reichenbachiella sp.]MDW3210877.1 pyridoxamine 5'-phosphate oxidase [Reichenbachiella sp.]